MKAIDELEKERGILRQAVAGIEKRIDRLEKEMQEWNLIHTPKHGDIVKTPCGGLRVVVLENGRYKIADDSSVMTWLKEDFIENAYRNDDYRKIGNVFESPTD